MNNVKNGGVPARIGRRFSKQIESIKDERLLNGLSKDRISTEKITNLIVKHMAWEKIKKDIINVSPREVLEYGL